MGQRLIVLRVIHSKVDGWPKSVCADDRPAWIWFLETLDLLKIANLGRNGRLDELGDIKHSDKTWREHDCLHWEDK